MVTYGRFEHRPDALNGVGPDFALAMIVIPLHSLVPTLLLSLPGEWTH